jgi:hypothetical protein
MPLAEGTHAEQDTYAMKRPTYTSPGPFCRLPKFGSANAPKKLVAKVDMMNQFVRPAGIIKEGDFCSFAVLYTENTF